MEPTPAGGKTSELKEDNGNEEEDEHHNWAEDHTALSFLLAGGIAGAGDG